MAIITQDPTQKSIHKSSALGTELAEDLIMGLEGHDLIVSKIKKRLVPQTDLFAEGLVKVEGPVNSSYEIRKACEIKWSESAHSCDRCKRHRRTCMASLCKQFDKGSSPSHKNCYNRIMTAIGQAYCWREQGWTPHVIYTDLVDQNGPATPCNARINLLPFLEKLARVKIFTHIPTKDDRTGLIPWILRI